MNGLRRGMVASELARAAAADPQFALPARPRVVPHLIQVPLADALIVDGTADLQVLRGEAAADLLPQLLPLLDGSRTLEAVALGLDRDLRHVTSAVALLYGCGLLEEAQLTATEDRPQPGGVSRETDAFLARCLDTTRVNASATEVRARMSRARVTLVGDPDHTNELCRLLRRAGVGSLTSAALPDAVASIDSSTQLVVVLDERVDADELARIDDRCAEAGVPWLRAASNGPLIEIGPRFERGFTACWPCFVAERRPGLDTLGTSTVGSSVDTLLSLVADEVIRLTARVGDSPSTRGVTELDLEGWTQRSVLVPRRPACTRCCPHGEAAEPSLAFRFEQSVAFPPRHLISPKDHQQHYRSTNIALQLEHKRWPGVHHVRLPSVDLLPAPTGSYTDTLRSPGPAANSLDLDGLAGLLLRVSGLRPTDGGGPPGPPGKVQRWTPSGGNLGSVGLYVLAHRITGLEPGWYGYEPDRHCLAALPDASERVQPSRSPSPDPTTIDPQRVMRGILGPSDEPDALVVTTAALSRVAHKYREFAYRLIHLDAGVAVAQLQAVARGYGLTAQLQTRWRDDLVTQQLGLDERAEPVTAVVTLTGRQRR